MGLGVLGLWAALRPNGAPTSPATAPPTLAATSATAGSPGADVSVAGSTAAAVSSAAPAVRPEPTFSVGDEVLVRRGRLAFGRGKVQAVKGEVALVSDEELPLAQISPASAPYGWVWQPKQQLAYLVPGTGRVGVGTVESVRIDSQLTVKAWDGMAETTVTFSPPQSMKFGHLPLVAAWPVRDSWVAELKTALADVEVARAADKRDACMRDTVCKAKMEEEDKKKAEAEAKEEKKKAEEAACKADPICVKQRAAVACRRYCQSRWPSSVDECVRAQWCE